MPSAVCQPANEPSWKRLRRRAGFSRAILSASIQVNENRSPWAAVEKIPIKTTMGKTTIDFILPGIL